MQEESTIVKVVKESAKKGESAGSNPMTAIRINRVVLNIGTGNDEKMQAGAKKLLQHITGRKPADGLSKKRIPTFKISKGTKISAFVTLRGDPAREILRKMFAAVDNVLPQTAISENSASFGIREYIEIPGIKYDPSIGMLGMNVSISFMRCGLRVSIRKRQMAYIPKKHRIIGRDEISEYLTKEFGIKVAAIGG